MAQGRVTGVVPIEQMSTRNNLTRKWLMPDPRIAELEHDLDAAQHLLHEIVICAFRREYGRDPTTKPSTAPITTSWSALVCNQFRCSTW